jgi:serine/threonine protein kinase/formylglycine-generating enzyme required for sulfatase activity/WD40 repeat protein
MDGLIDDQRQRWGAGDPRSVDDYLALYPDLRREPGLLIALIVSEYELRQQRGETPTVEEYSQRFPELADSLQARLSATLPFAPRQTMVVRDAAVAVSKSDGHSATLPYAGGNHSPTGYAAGSEFGDYLIEQEIARGGMGVVFRARQRALNRLVALKMIRTSGLPDSEEFRRFRTEAEAAAKLSHPGIVPVYEVGLHDGQPFYSMALVEGGSLSDLVQSGPVDNRRAARLVREVATAVQAAHSRNIVHRDLKPANILLDRDGRPLVADFGLAKDVEQNSELTATGAILGTPNFMAPEQAAGRTHEVGPLADVYALGGILYFLLTGRPPFKGQTLVETIQRVLHEEPASPRVANARVDVDLATICLKCLEKDQAHRFTSAAALVDELDRYLAGRPIASRPTGAGERAWRWARRNPALSLVGGALLALLLLLSFTGPWIAWQFQRQNAELASSNVLLDRLNDDLAGTNSDLQRTNQELATSQGALRRTVSDLESSERNLRETLAENQAKLYQNLLLTATQAQEKGDHATVRQSLEQTPSELRGWEYELLTSMAPQLPDEVFQLPGGWFFDGLLLGSDRRTVARVTSETQGGFYRSRGVALWNLETREPVRRTNLDQAPVGDVEAYTLHGSATDGLIATLHVDRQQQSTPPAIALWNMATGELLRTLTPDPQSTVMQSSQLAFSPDGASLAHISSFVSGRIDSHPTGGTMLQIFDGASGERRHRHLFDGWLGKFAGYSPDGRQLAWTRAVSPPVPGTSASRARPGLLVCDPDSGHVVAEFDVTASCLAWHPGSRWLAIGDRDGTLRGLRTQTDRMEMSGTHGRLPEYDIDYPAGSEVFRANESAVGFQSVAFDESGRHLVTAQADGSITVRRTNGSVLFRGWMPSIRGATPTYHATFGPSETGSVLAFNGRDIAEWKQPVNRQQYVGGLTGVKHKVSQFSDDGTRIVVLRDEGIQGLGPVLEIHSADRPGPLNSWRLPDEPAESEAYHFQAPYLALHAGGRIVALFGWWKDQVAIADLETGEIVRVLAQPNHSILNGVFLADDDSLFCVTPESVGVWNWRTGELLREQPLSIRGSLFSIPCTLVPAADGLPECVHTSGQLSAVFRTDTLERLDTPEASTAQHAAAGQPVWRLSSGGKVERVSFPTLQVLEEIPGPADNEILAVGLPDRLLTVRGDELRVWSESRRELLLRTRFFQPIRNVLIHPTKKFPILAFQGNLYYLDPDLLHARVATPTPAATPKSPVQPMRYRFPEQQPPAVIAPLAPTRAAELQRAWSEASGAPLEVTNSIGLTLRLIPPGRFTQGLPAGEVQRRIQQAVADESPEWYRQVLAMEENPQEVTLPRPHFLSAHEVTLGQYRAVMGALPPGVSEGPDVERLPATNVSWVDAVRFCNRLSEREDRRPCYNLTDDQVELIVGDGYRLPTEGEWEYATRAGGTGEWWFGDDPQRLGEFDWVAENSGGRLHPVGQLAPNPFGLYDLHGNAREWCENWMVPLPNFALAGRMEPQRHSYAWNGRRVAKGGWVNSPAALSRAGLRYWSVPTTGIPDEISFRVVLRCRLAPTLP